MWFPRPPRLGNSSPSEGTFGSTDELLLLGAGAARAGRPGSGTGYPALPLPELRQYPALRPRAAWRRLPVLRLLWDWPARGRITARCPAACPGAGAGLGGGDLHRARAPLGPAGR